MCGEYICVRVNISVEIVFNLYYIILCVRLHLEVASEAGTME